MGNFLTNMACKVKIIHPKMILENIARVLGKFATAKVEFDISGHRQKGP